MADSTRLRVPRKLDGGLTTISTVSTASGPICRAGDKIVLNILSTDAVATVEFEGRILTVEGDVVPWRQLLTVAGAGTPTSVEVPLTDGWIVGFSAYVASGTITAGEMEGRVDVVRNEGAVRRIVMTLSSGDLTNTKALGLGAFT